MSLFNPLTYSKNLKDAGVPEQQAQAQAEGLHSVLETMENHFASKEDLKNLEYRLENKFDGRIDKLDSKINTVENILTSKIAAVDTKLNWLMTLMSSIGLILALLNFIHFHL